MANLSLCFVKYKDSFLLINRNKSPFMGMWNGVGGHQEANETMEECAKREIYEETGIHVQNIELMGKFTWNFDDDMGYLYVACLSDDFSIKNFPLKNQEGIVDFKTISWILHPKNTGVIADLVIFIKELAQNNKNTYHFVYDTNNQLISYQKNAWD